MKGFIGTLILASLFGCTFATGLYDGYKLIQINLTNSEQVGFVREELGDKVDYWMGPSRLFPTEIMLSPEQFEKSIGIFAKQGIRMRVINDDIQASIDQINEENERQKKRLNGRIVGTFARYDEIKRWLEALPSSSGLASTTTIGTSTEGRSIIMVKLGTNTPGKRGIFLDSAIHAREWLSPATAIWIIDQMLATYSSNANVQFALNNYNWYFVIPANPDGYEFTHNSNRMWRKTRSIQAGGCIGTDPNRNFDYVWGGDGTSSNPCSDIYKGPFPWSEPEVRALRDQIRSLNLRAYLAFHTYVPCISYPYAYTDGAIITPPNAAELHRISREVSDAIFAVNGQRFRYGNTVELLGAGAGGSDDWAVGAANVPISYTMELRGGSLGGFLASVFDIEPSGREVLAGFLQLARSL